MQNSDPLKPHQKLAALLEQASRFLAESDSARLDAELLLAKVLEKDRVFLRTWPDFLLEERLREKYAQLLARRKKGEPVAYLLGRWEFWSLPLQVNEHTLVPRPETELLVEQALAQLPDGPYKVADLGTGSGAIALALATERPNWQIWASDFSADALEVARANSRQLSLSNVQFVQGSWCEALPSQRFHMIVSNPPYISSDDPHLKGDGLPFEPQAALVAEENGLKDIMDIAQQAVFKLLDGGWLMVEHGADQGEAVREIFSSQQFRSVLTQRDLSGMERLTLGQTGEYHA
jgi:release factor glutamine methyltransferase